MVTATSQSRPRAIWRGHFAVVVAALPLLWPAFYNHYPLVFADTGTYLSQAIDHYIGWARPPVYSLFMLPLHLTVTTWPVIIVQAWLVAYLLRLTQRSLLPRSSPEWLPVLTAILAVTTSLPWFASQLMPDLFTPLLVLSVALLLFVPRLLSGIERGGLTLLVTFMLAVHLSNLPLVVFLLAVLWPFARVGTWRLAVPMLVAATALLAMHLIGPRQTGNVFLLARVLYDGPGMATLLRECPRRDWRLCAYIGQFPPLADDFLWHSDSPLQRIGGPIQAGAEAASIVTATLQAAPLAEARSFLANAGLQLSLFATGDGLQAWPDTVTPWMVRDFPPREVARYLAARQQHGELMVPRWLQQLHRTTALAGVAGCAAVVWLGRRHQQRAAGFAAIMLLALVGNAAITGGLSGPHDRYQSRLIWLAPAIALLTLPTVLPRRTVAASLQVHS